MWICQCGHKDEDHWNGWAECDECSCILFEPREFVPEEEDAEFGVLTYTDKDV